MAMFPALLGGVGLSVGETVRGRSAGKSVSRRVGSITRHATRSVGPLVGRSVRLFAWDDFWSLLRHFWVILDYNFESSFQIRHFK